jgi:glycerol-3-phosphate cytidylyltransferase
MLKTVAYTAGVWDMLHIGHINFLEKAKSMADVLIVGVQSDESVANQKGTKPVISLPNRIKTIEALRCVDIAVPYDDFDYLAHAKAVTADMFVLSEEHKGKKRFLELEHRMNVVYLPYDQSISTTKIKDVIRNPWGQIWESVAKSEKNDVEIVGHHSPEVTTQLADYFFRKLQFKIGDSILDYGCGAGLILSHFDTDNQCIGIDISPSMIKRAKNNCPWGLFHVSDHIPLEGHVDHIISWGVLHYIDDLDRVSSVIDKMISLSDSILLAEIPDIRKRDKRLKKRREMGKIIDPEPMYYDIQFFVDKGFKILHDHPNLTDNSEFSFGVMYDPIC